jgi:hypothetical protein
MKIEKCKNVKIKEYETKNQPVYFRCVRGGGDTARTPYVSGETQNEHKTY